MKTDQIISYLLVSTTIVIFAMLVLYSMQTAVGNGGEYWGFDGIEDPYGAAQTSWASGDYRFLDVNLPPYEEYLTAVTPGVGACVNHPASEALRFRPSGEVPLHTDDSLRLAAEFAWRYNTTLVKRLNAELGAECEVHMRRSWWPGEVPGVTPRDY